MAGPSSGSTGGRREEKADRITSINVYLSSPIPAEAEGADAEIGK